MIDKLYLDNLTPRNVIKDYTPKDLSVKIDSSTLNDFLDNMIINSNLENENIIK